MRTHSLLLVALSLMPWGHSKPLVNQTLDDRVKKCGAVGRFFSPLPESWYETGTQDWLNAWWKNNSASFSKNDQGFAGALGWQFLGNPRFFCKDDGGDCTMDECNNRALNGAGVDTLPAYLTLLSVVNLQHHYSGLKEAYSQSNMFASLSQANWAQQFFIVKPAFNFLFIQELLSALAVIVGIVGSLLGGEGLVVGAVGAAAGVAAGGAANGFNLHASASSVTDTAAADLGATLAATFLKGVETYTSTWNDLMAGNSPQGSQGDIRSYIDGGAYLNMSGVNVNEVTNYFVTMVTAKAINALWSEQKVFIMGGGPCDGPSGIGSGPQEAKLCRDNRAWYLYYWHEGNGNYVSDSQYGYVTSPPGADLLGKDLLVNITVEDIINSSLDAYGAGQFNYTATLGSDRMQNAVIYGWADPYKEGAAWEGTFTVPVCNVSWAISQNFLRQKQYVLQPYNARPQWCGPVCNGKSIDSAAFLAAAHMDGFRSPTHACIEDQSVPVPLCNRHDDRGATNDAIDQAIQSIDMNANYGFSDHGSGFQAEPACKASSSKGSSFCCVVGSGDDGYGGKAYVIYTTEHSSHCGNSDFSTGADIISIADEIQGTCTDGPPNSNSGRFVYNCMTVMLSANPCVL